MLDAGLAYFMLTAFSLFLAPKSGLGNFFGADLGVVALLSISAVAATWAVSSRSGSAGADAQSAKGWRPAILQGARAVFPLAFAADTLGSGYLAR